MTPLCSLLLTPYKEKEVGGLNWEGIRYLNLLIFFFHFQEGHTAKDQSSVDCASSTEAAIFNSDSELVRDVDSKLPFPIQRESPSVEKSALGNNTFLQQKLIKTESHINSNASPQRVSENTRHQTHPNTYVNVNLSAVQQKSGAHRTASPSCNQRRTPFSTSNMPPGAQQVKSVQLPDLETDAAPTEPRQETGKPGAAAKKLSRSQGVLGLATYYHIP